MSIYCRTDGVGHVKVDVSKHWIPITDMLD